MKRLLVLLAIFATLTTSAQVAPKPKQTTERQCLYLYRDELQCTSAAQPGKEYCRQHAEGMPRCGDDIDGKKGGRTKKGLPCRMVVKVKGERCYRHVYQ